MQNMETFLATAGPAGLIHLGGGPPFNSANCVEFRLLTPAALSVKCQILLNTLDHDQNFLVTVLKADTNKIASSKMNKANILYCLRRGRGVGKQPLHLYVLLSNINISFN